MNTKLTLSVLLFAALPACTLDLAVDGLEANATDAVTVAFESDWTIQQSGPLAQSKPARILYDAERLTECRGDQHGRPAWAITGYFSLNGAPAESFHVAGLSASGSQDAPIILLPHPGDLAVWFHNTNRWGCSAYDSDFGENYSFVVE